MKKPTIFNLLSPLRTLSALPVRKKIYIVILLLLIITLFGLIVICLPPGIDWLNVYRPSALNLLSAKSPYEISGYYNPPWAALFLLPFAVFPVKVGAALLLIVGLILISYTAHRLGAKPLAVIILLFSPPVMHGALNGNIDWLAVIGLILPPQIGLFFVSIKPQIGIAVMIFWLFAAWKKNGWREVVRVFGPFTICLLISFLAFGFWITRSREVISEWWNASLWPASIPVGLALLVAAIRKGRIEYAMGASPCLSPHVLLHSWVGALLAIASSTPELITAVIGLWILVAIRGFGG